MQRRDIMECLRDPANVQQTSSKCNVGRLLDRVNTLSLSDDRKMIVNTKQLAATNIGLATSPV